MVKSIKTSQKTVGILSLQGDFKEHEEILKKMEVPTQQVRLPKDLTLIDRLIIPGGESTTIGHLLVLHDLLTPIKNRVKKGMPLWGTCAGAILMAKHITDGKEGQPSLLLMDITARRNGYGRQIDSFEATVAIPKVDTKPFDIVFIRAPILESPGKNVTVLARLSDGKIIAAQQEKMLATCFHPELFDDTRFHSYFLRL